MEEKKPEFRFSSEDVRYYFMNRIYIVCSSLIWAVYIVYSVIKATSRTLPMWIVNGLAAAAIFFSDCKHYYSEEKTTSQRVKDDCCD